MADYDVDELIEWHLRLTDSLKQLHINMSDKHEGTIQALRKLKQVMEERDRLRSILNGEHQ